MTGSPQGGTFVTNVSGHVRSVINIAHADNVWIREGPTTLHQAPGPPADFTNREAELQGALGSIAPGAPVFLRGIGGTGKTVLALAIAERMRANLDIELYAEGQDREGNGVPIETILRDWLRTLDDPQADSLTTVPALAGRLRSHLDGRRALVILDDATTIEQVQGVESLTNAMVVVTTRTQRPASLRDVALAPFSVDSGVTFLEKVLGRDRVANEMNAASMLVALTGGLPLALRLVCGRLTLLPRASLQDYADTLRDEATRLAELDPGDHGLRATLGSAYAELTTDEAERFRRFCYSNVGRLGVDALIKVGGGDRPAVFKTVEKLAALGLLHEVAPEQYEIHDLVRLYAVEVGRTIDHPDAETSSRLMAARWYAAAVAFAANRIRPEEADAIESFDSVHLPPLADDEMTAAIFWLEQEKATIRQLATWAAESGELVLASNLLEPLSKYFSMRTYWNEWRDTLLEQVSVAKQRGDQKLIIRTIQNLGIAYGEAGDLETAESHLLTALEQYKDAKDRRGEARTLSSLANLLKKQRRHDKAVPLLEGAVTLYRQESYAPGEARALADLANALDDLQRTAEGLDIQKDALEIFERLGMDHEAAWAHEDLGVMHRRLRDYESAEAEFVMAKKGFGRLGNASRSAGAAAHVIHVLAIRGDRREAVAYADSVLPEFSKEAAVPILMNKARALVTLGDATAFKGVFLELRQVADREILKDLLVGAAEERAAAGDQAFVKSITDL